MRGKLHKVYHLSGTPYEIGYQHGEMTAEITKRYVDSFSYGDQYREHPWLGAALSPEEYTIENYKKEEPSQHAKWEKLINSQPDWMLQEIRGIADGAKVDYEKLLIVKGNFPIVFKRARPREEGKKESSITFDDDNCSGFVAFGKGTVGGKTMVAGNSEGVISYGRGSAIFLIKNRKMNNLALCQREAGTLGGHVGINDKGVALFGSGVMGKPEEFGTIGLESQVIRRKVLQTCNNIDEVIDFFKETPKIAAKHIYVADPKRVIHIEFTGKHLNIMEPEEFSAGSSSTFTSPKMKAYTDALTDETDPRFAYYCSNKLGEFRVERYLELFQEHKPLTPEKCPKLLGDHGGKGTGQLTDDFLGAINQGSDYTICVHGQQAKYERQTGRPYKLPAHHGTSGSQILVPHKKTLYEAFGRPCEAGFVEFKVPT